MPHPNAPLSYENREILLKHMNPNQRALLSLRCPDLRTLDSITPQKISEICLEPNSITINNTTYLMGIVLQYPKGVTYPKSHVDMNERNGVQYDMDKYGFKTFRPIGTPGDIYIPGINEPFSQETLQNHYKDALKSMEKKLEELMQKRDILHGSPGSENELEELEKMIREVEAELVPFRLKEDKKDVPFSLYLQLTILKNDPDGPKVEATERVEYNRSLGSALAYLIRRLLTRTKSHVDILRITSMMKRGFFWLPTEMKLAANHLKIETNCANILGAIEQFFHPAHRRPFRTVEISMDQELNYNERILGTAGTLIINHVKYAHLYGTIGHPLVHLNFGLDYRSFMCLIDHWRRNAPSIGTHYFCYTNLLRAPAFYDGMISFEDHFVEDTPTRRVPCLPHCVILPLTDNAQLEFFLTPLSEPVDVVGRQCGECRLMLNLEVQPRW